MNKFSTILFLLIICFNHSNSQLSISIHSGYQFPFAKTYIGSSIFVSPNDTSFQASATYTYKSLRGSFASGFSNTILLEYRVTKNCSLNMGVNYSLYTKYVLGLSSGNIHYEETIQAKNYIVLIPSFSYSAQNSNNIKPFGRIGFSLPTFGYLRYTKDLRISDNPNYSRVEIWKYTTGLRVGINTTIGFLYPVNKKTKFLFEATSNSMSLYLKKGSMIKYEESGIDKLPEKAIYDKEIEFVNSYEESSAAPIDQAKPRKAIGYNHSFSYFGLSLGLNFSL